MPRQTHKHAETLNELHLKHLQVKIRMDQVKLRKLEWSTHSRALPHITPLPGDTEEQIRKVSPPKPSLLERYNAGDADLDPKLAVLIGRAKEKLAERTNIPPCPLN